MVSPLNTLIQEENSLLLQEGYFSISVEPHWKKLFQCKQKYKLTLKRNEEPEQKSLSSVTDLNENKANETNIEFEDEDYQPEEKKAKFQLDGTGGRRDMPQQY